MATKKDRMTIHHLDGVAVLDLGNMDIWDGADLALLRETLSRLVERDGCRSIGIDIRHVKYIPSGFFGMLYDWHDHGVAVRLYTPQPNVENMLWFRQFFNHLSNGCYLLHSEPKTDPVPTAKPAWNNGNHEEQSTNNAVCSAENKAPSVAAADRN